ncbi:MAG: preprotein translocase subunit Sec61beta [Candidatus Methanomethylophilaceae archaeon]|nr:preprotein translocase subunit Sec61beta [Candidatus Methanomethylophilaceae archaeon]MDY5872581.1 preprotein translocase subunit Sec61beta [Candidatus Methanomethylophilaceae archaeon]
MAKKNEGGGFSQSAGLMRYFDSEDTDKALKITPKGVVIAAVSIIVAVLLLQVFVPMN